MPKAGLLNVNMPKTRRLILLAIKEHGELTADELAGMLNISTVAVRRHLDNLKSAGFIKYEETHQGVGRPSYVYSLTAKADQIFPRNYQDLASDMIDTIREMYGKEAVEEIFKARSKKITDIYRPHINSNSLSGRVKQLVQLRKTDGYMTSWEQEHENEYVVTELNCPIHEVAKECGQACNEDIKMFSDLLDADVIMLNHRVQGAKSCSYKILPKEKG